jgi:hypothetical protein
VEDNFDLNFLDPESVFASFEIFPKLSFQDGEYGFNLVSLMIFFLIKRLIDPSSIVSGYLFSFSVSDRDEKTGAQGILDQFMDLFGIVSFVHDIEVRRSGSVTLFEEFLGMRNIMDRMLGDLQTSDNLLIHVNGDGCFQESFSGFPGSL